MEVAAGGDHWHYVWDIHTNKLHPGFFCWPGYQRIWLECTAIFPQLHGSDVLWPSYGTSNWLYRSESGLRTVGIVGLIGHSLAYVVLSLNTGSLLLWYLSWALVAILGAGSLPIIWTGVLNNWFTKHRGKAIGITMAGTGLGAFLLPPIVEFLITHHGWRTAYRGIGLGALFISLPIVFVLFKEKPDFSVQGL